VDGQVTTPHKVLNPDSLSPPSGFSHVVSADAGGRLLFLGGQTAHDSSGQIADEDVVAQFDAAATNVLHALRAGGADAEHLVNMHIFVTDLPKYKASLRDLGAVYRKHFGDHYPAISLFEVKGLFDPAAVVELVCTAVVPSS
jgi:enamine deaminase RidA (YjgF/YER057c/UK114 family)